MEVQYQESSWPGSVFMLTIDFVFGMLQNIQHFLYDGLQGPAQLFCRVRFSQRRHVDERRPPTALVQGGVVGEVTEVPGTQNQRSFNEKKRDKRG